jgi:hypothetical protein
MGAQRRPERGDYNEKGIEIYYFGDTAVPRDSGVLWGSQGRGLRQRHYIAPGFTCSIGDMTFANFTWTTSNTPGGAAPPATSEMAVPDGLGFDLDGLFTASSGATADANLHYTVTTTDGTNTLDSVRMYAVGGQSGTGTRPDVRRVMGGPSLGIQVSRVVPDGRHRASRIGDGPDERYDICRIGRAQGNGVRGGRREWTQ